MFNRAEAFLSGKFDVPVGDVVLKVDERFSAGPSDADVLVAETVLPVA